MSRGGCSHPNALEQVPLSRRQRQALEGVLQTPAPPASPRGDLSIWEALQHASLGRLLEALAGAPGELAEGSSILRLPCIGILPASDFCPRRATGTSHGYLSRCLQLQPQQPFVHYQLAQMFQQQQQYDTALHHMLATWQGLQETQEPVQVWHLEILNQLLSLLEKTQQYESFPEWLASLNSSVLEYPPRH